MPRQFKKYANIPYSDTLIENYLKLIKENPRLTSREIAEKLNCSYQTIKNLRSHLIKAKIMPHSLTPKEEYPEEEEEEDYKDEIIEKLKDEIETLREIIYRQSIEKNMLNQRIKVLMDTKKEKLENEINALKNKMDNLRNEINKLKWNFNDDLKERIQTTLLRSQKIREYWNLHDKLKNLENELSKLLS
jgi:chromosome segregation ATPase